MNLKQLIGKNNKIDIVDDEITEENFPYQKVRGTDYKLFHISERTKSKKIVSEMEKEGYVPATLYELLSWGGWEPFIKNGQDKMVALGSSFTNTYGYRNVVCICKSQRGYDLSTVAWDVEWEEQEIFLGCATGTTKNTKQNFIRVVFRKLLKVVKKLRIC